MDSMLRVTGTQVGMAGSVSLGPEPALLFLQSPPARLPPPIGSFTARVPSLSAPPPAQTPQMASSTLGYIASVLGLSNQVPRPSPP